MLLYLRGDSYKTWLKGPAVRRCQEIINRVLGDGAVVADSVFGPMMEAAVEDLQRKLKKRADGIYGPNTHKAALQYLGVEPSGVKVYERDGVKIIDGRTPDFPPLTHHTPGTMRSWSQIDGVMLHQTGCNMPEDPATWARVGTQCGVTRQGSVVIMREFELMIYHATVTSISRRTIGIEIAGNMRGTESAAFADHTYWRGGGGPHKLLDCQIEGAHVLMAIIHEAFKKHDQPFSLIVGHRQTDHNRENDPGEAIWKNIALPWQQKLCATDGGPSASWGRGAPIPELWNPQYKGNKWWQG